jgi:hypothetical protein
MEAGDTKRKWTQNFDGISWIHRHTRKKLIKLMIQLMIQLMIAYCIQEEVEQPGAERSSTYYGIVNVKFILD